MRKTRDACVSVLFLGEELLPGARFHSTFRVREIHDQHDLTDRLELHVIELSKLGNAEPDDQLTAWGRFFAAKSDEELEALAMTAPEIREAKAALYEISADEKARQLALDRELNEAAHKIYVGAAYHSGKREGREEGRAEGVAEGLRLAVSSMAKALGLELDEAQEARIAASDVQQLEALLDFLARERTWPEQFTG
jgi:predicted transposase/invertase (TIGR01784 family)